MNSNLTYFKRYRMERAVAPPPNPTLSAGFRIVPWDDRMIDVHADVLFRCFVDDLDGRVFPNLARVDGCRSLIRVIRGLDGFCRLATAMAAGPDGYAGVVEGIIDPNGHGAIQNIGVTPDARGLGLGAALLAYALGGFDRVGAKWCHLEVSAENEPAVRLYQRFGFRKTRVLYKGVPTENTGSVGSGI